MKSDGEKKYLTESGCCDLATSMKYIMCCENQFACGKEHDLGRFGELVMNVYFDTDPDGFDALYELE